MMHDNQIIIHPPTNPIPAHATGCARLDYVPTRIAGHKLNRLDELLPWRGFDLVRTPDSPPAPSIRSTRLFAITLYALAKGRTAHLSRLL